MNTVTLTHAKPVDRARTVLRAAGRALRALARTVSTLGESFARARVAAACAERICLEPDPYTRARLERQLKAYVLGQHACIA